MIDRYKTVESNAPCSTHWQFRYQYVTNLQVQSILEPFRFQLPHVLCEMLQRLAKLLPIPRQVLCCVTSLNTTVAESAPFQLADKSFRTVVASSMLLHSFPTTGTSKYGTEHPVQNTDTSTCAMLCSGIATSSAYPIKLLLQVLVLQLRFREISAAKLIHSHTIRGSIEGRQGNQTMVVVSITTTARIPNNCCRWFHMQMNKENVHGGQPRTGGQVTLGSIVLLAIEPPRLRCG